MTFFQILQMNANSPILLRAYNHVAANRQPQFTRQSFYEGGNKTAE